MRKNADGGPFRALKVVFSLVVVASDVPAVVRRVPPEIVAASARTLARVLVCGRRKFRAALIAIKHETAAATPVFTALLQAGR